MLMFWSLADLHSTEESASKVLLGICQSSNIHQQKYGVVPMRLSEAVHLLTCRVFTCNSFHLSWIEEGSMWHPTDSKTVCLRCS